MSHAAAYTVARVNADSFRLDRAIPPAQGAAAYVIRVRDRLGNPLGWKLRPMVIMQGSKSRLWPHAADAIASTKLLKPGEARSAIAAVTLPGDAP